MDKPAASGEIYTEILQGLAAYYHQDFIRNVARTAEAFPSLALANALNRKQLACKGWLLDRLSEVTDGKFNEIWVMGGWFAVLAALMFDDERFTVGRITSFDLDPHCEEVACAMNLKQAAAGRFSAETADMRALDYPRGIDLLVNTSCEHIANLAAWLGRLPAGQLLVLQSNNYFREPDHVNCVNSLEAFQAQAGLAQTLYAGELPLEKYTRFMLIGRK